MTDEYAEFRDEPTGNFTTVLRQLADELVLAEQNILKAQEALEVANAVKKDIAEFRIPQMTDGMDGKFNLGDGRELSVKEEVRASIAGEKRIPAINWLDDNDYGHIVKRQIIIEFGKNETERSEKFLECVKELEKELGTLVVKKNWSVHPATLVSWVKEQLGEGVNLPTEIFGIFRQRVAKVKEL